jgi:glycosyltransferase involved in cell wall biosynthesis
MKILYDRRWEGMHGIGRISYAVNRFLKNRTGLELSYIKKEKVKFVTDPFYLSMEISRHHPDLFFTPGFNPPFFSSAPFVFTICDLIPLFVPELWKARKAFYYNSVVRWAGRKASGILTISEYSREEIIAWGNFPPDKVHSVYLAAGKAFDPVGSVYENPKPYYLYVGNHSPHKNVRRLLQAFTQSGLSREFDLLLAGMPEGFWSSTIRELGMEDSIKQLGFIPDRDLPSLYRGAFCFVFPSLYEGFGLPPLEAMACGTPVVVSNAASLPEVAGKAGIYVDPVDVESIADGLIQMGDSSLRNEMAGKGLKQSEKFSWEKTTERIWRVLQNAAR